MTLQAKTTRALNATPPTGGVLGISGAIISRYNGKTSHSSLETISLHSHLEDFEERNAR